MNFFQKIKSSIYSPKFYAALPKASLGSAFGYFFLLALVLTGIQSALLFVSWGGFSNPQREAEKALVRVQAQYPKDLVVTIKNGMVSTTATEPYVIAMPEEAGDEAVNLLVIDTKTPFSTTQFNKYTTILWLTKDSLIVGGDKQVRAIDLSKIKNITIDKTSVASMGAHVSPWLKLITPAVIVGVIIGTYLLYVARLLYLLILSLLILLVGKMLKQAFSFGTAYKIGLHAVTLGFLVELVVWWTPLAGFPFLLTLITLGVVIFNFLPKQKVKK